jgi:hypothetical protein
MFFSSYFIVQLYLDFNAIPRVFLEESKKQKKLNAWVMYTI